MPLRDESFQVIEVESMMISCPSASQIKSQFKELLSAPEHHLDLAAHVEACSLCQARLESLLDDEQDAPYRNGASPVPEPYPSKLPTMIDRPAPAQSREGDAPLPSVPGYELLGRLGRGGMGVVYKARHLKLNRLVALKMIRAESPSPEQRNRFQVEAQAVARLLHPNIVQIYEVAEHDGSPYLALELVEGGTLANRLDHKPLAPRYAASLLQTLAGAIEAAHAAGVVHRDLKPANVLIADRGWRMADSSEQSAIVKITDFGLAKKLDDSVGPTQTGQVMGTPEYMAPEQAAGKANEVGPRADVWALGAILYKCLTGRPPFSGASPLDTIRQVINDEPAAPTSLQRQIPRNLETVCLKCLNKESRGDTPRHATWRTTWDDSWRVSRFKRGGPAECAALERLPSQPGGGDPGRDGAAAPDHDGGRRRADVAQFALGTD